MRELYVAPDGRDEFSGTLASVNESKTDGPLATLQGAKDRIRQLKTSARIEHPFTVHIRGGRFAVTAPIVFTPEDSGAITYAAYGDEKPVFDGAQDITGWREEKLANGKVAWLAELPDVRARRWYFRSLFVDGQRRPRTLYPKDGQLEIIDVPEITREAQLFEGTTNFVTRTEDVRELRNLSDVDVLVNHYWVEERLPIQSWDKASGRLTSTRRSIFALKLGFGPEWAKYRLENLFEALESPGEWYLDRSAGKLYYLPRPGEQMSKTRICAPRARQFIRLEGHPESQQYVEYLAFRGLTIANFDWQQSTGMAPEHDHLPEGVLMGSDAQAAVGVEGVINCNGVRYCAFEDLEIRAIGEYAFNMLKSCVGNRIVGNHLSDIGAGGVKIYGVPADMPRHLRSGNNRITDNHIQDIGEVFKPAIGVIICHGHGNTIAHNHIHDTHYSGISVGWVWGYAESVSRDNLIEKNHIHHIGKGMLSDMGGIYTLGVQPGTMIRGNLIHDVKTHQYGGWAIYPDEGSSHMVIENNVCFNTDCSSFHTHYGRELIVRNNILAFGGEGLIALGRAENHNAFTFTHNIVITDGQAVHYCGYTGSLRRPTFISDYNILWDVSGKPPAGGMDFKSRGAALSSIAELQTAGLEVHSLAADPRCRAIAARDFTLLPDSPAFAMGFKPIDLSDVGPRPREQRG